MRCFVLFVLVPTYSPEPLDSLRANPELCRTGAGVLPGPFARPRLRSPLSRRASATADKLTLDGLLRTGALRRPPKQSPILHRPACANRPQHQTVVSACTLYLVFKEPNCRGCPRLHPPLPCAAPCLRTVAPPDPSGPQIRGRFRPFFGELLSLPCALPAVKPRTPRRRWGLCRGRASSCRAIPVRRTFQYYGTDSRLSTARLSRSRSPLTRQKNCSGLAGAIGRTLAGHALEQFDKVTATASRCQHPARYG